MRGHERGLSMEGEVGKVSKGENVYLNNPWVKFYPEGIPSEIDIPEISLIQAFVKGWRNGKTRLP